MTADCKKNLVSLTVYEADGSEATWKSTRVHENGWDYDIDLSLTNTVADRTTQSEMSEAFVYTMKDKTYIGLERHSVANLFADGVDSRFLYLEYANGKLKLVDQISFSGSDADQEYYNETAAHLKKMGININSEKWLWGESMIRDVVKWKVRLYGIHTTNLLEMGKGWAWMEKPAKGIQLEDIYFYTQKELLDVKTSSEQDDGQIFSFSSTAKLTEREVEWLSSEQLHFAVNEIYARHGYIFKKEPYKSYYPKYSWYKPKYDSSTFDEKVFNKVEQANIKLLKSRY